jgi:hypothetical protein
MLVWVLIGHPVNIDFDQNVRVNRLIDLVGGYEMRITRSFLGSSGEFREKN